MPIFSTPAPRRRSKISISSWYRTDPSPRRNTSFDVARTTIVRYGGTVEKFIGDAVMAVWGAPVAQEDDVRLALCQDVPRRERVRPALPQPPFGSDDVRACGLRDLGRPVG